MIMIKPEILAPAGDFECLASAVKFGADAVFLAGKQFGMRTASKNFDTEELKKFVEMMGSGAAPAPKKKAQAAAAPTPEPAPVPAAEPKPELPWAPVPAAAPAVTRQAVQTKAIALMDAGKQEQLQALLKKYNVPALPSIPEDQLAAFMADLEAV